MTKPQREPTRRSLRNIGAGVAALALGVGVPTSTAGAATTTEDGSEVVALLNGERTSRGLAPLRLEGTLDAGADAHAGSMAGSDTLFHTSMTGTAPEGWTRLGENVGQAGSAVEVHRLLMASAPHRAAILDRGFDYVGIGVVHGSGSSHWVSMKFADHPAAGRVGSAASQPGRSVSSDGRVSTVGKSFHGDLSGTRLAAPVVGLVPTPSDAGYWLVGADGGVFTFGDARYAGSAGGLRLAAPIVGMAGMPDGSGYWLAGADGGVFAFGAAPYLGSMADQRLSAPIARINPSSTGGGYALYGADGVRHGFGDAR